MFSRASAFAPLNVATRRCFPILRIASRANISLNGTPAAREGLERVRERVHPRRRRDGRRHRHGEIRVEQRAVRIQVIAVDAPLDAVAPAYQNGRERDLRSGSRVVGIMIFGTPGFVTRPSP
jgi:hypothetical protein